MTTNIVDGTNNMEDEGGGCYNQMSAHLTFAGLGENPQIKAADVCVNNHAINDEELDGQQSADIFFKNVGEQQRREERERRTSLPVDSIELPTITGVVMRRKQQIQLRYNQQVGQKQPSPMVLKSGRPLSISSVSSAASSGSSSSAQSSTSSGVQSLLTRNGSLNYGHEYRKCAYLASIESLNNPQSNTEARSIEAALRNLNLTPSGHFKDAAARAAVLAAGAQSRGFGTSRINRSLHASLRYDKNAAARIHTMANARAQLYKQQASAEESQLRSSGTVSRNNSSTSSDSGHHRPLLTSNVQNSKLVCRCGSNPSLAFSTSDSQVNQATTGHKDPHVDALNNKSATIDSGSCQRVVKHRPDCSYIKNRPKRSSAKLHPSPSSASSHSNTSSLFRDDGFEDDLNSSASEHMSIYPQHHRLSFQAHIQYHSRRAGEEDDEYQSCEEEFANSHTTASTASNLDDCALSTASSSVAHHERRAIDEITLANAKQQYRKSLLLEHRQQQQIHAQQSSQNKIQSLLSSSPKICHLGPHTPNHSANTSTTSSASCISPTKQTKCDDRTVNIIGHMPTRSPGYWDSNLSISQRVVTEIIETERTYVDDLEQIVTGYICYLRNVLKQQKHQQSREVEGSRHATDSKLMVSGVSEDDDKSITVFDDDTTSATNDVEDDDVEEAENEVATKGNLVDKNCESKHDHPATDGAIMTANHIKKLFSNLEDIYKFNKDLLFRLEECYLNPSSVAECFVENAPGFEIYTHYCTMYPQVVSTLTELMANPTSAQLLKERQNELNQSLPLGAYLLKPVQRILKYHILFQSLIKHTTDDDTIDEKDRQLIGEAFSVMTSIACHINAMKKRHENAIRVQEVQGLLSGWDGPDLTTLGELILEDSFKIYNRPKSSRHLFLFDNVLLITKKKRDGSLCYKGHIACSNLMLIENIEGQPLVFNTVPFDNPKALCAFQAKNLDKKRDWCLQMKEVMIKSFEVKIPVHVRDILMSLTKNNNVDTASPKTSSEAARVLRAPNYLDRKRVKQEKKK